MSRHRDDNSQLGESPAPGLERTREALERIHLALRGLRYGTVTAVVQDGVVVQVERTEKIRLDRRGQREPSS
jgi:hypothetical protein